MAVLSTEFGENIVESTHYLEQLKDFTRFELEGVKAATVSTYNADIDGLSGNPRAVAIRRHDLINETGTIPLVSARHCGNHGQNLVDCCVIKACDASILAYMNVFACFGSS